ncbi:MAG: iron-sulfur cluster assembly scaffold protein [Hyphomicrobiaceae bacterium]
MTELSDLYSQRIIELAATIPPAGHLTAPDATASAHSKLCGSTIAVELAMDGDRVKEYAQTVKACLLGQASAAIMARNIVGASEAELREVAAQMRRMLKEGGAPPGGRWADLAALEPVREVKGRHASTLLAFEAVVRALDQIAEKRQTREAASTRD